MLLHVACYYHLLSQIHTIYQISFRARVYKNWVLETSEFLKKGSLLGEKLCSEFVHLK